jgi:hypothetical protein
MIQQALQVPRDLQVFFFGARLKPPLGAGI